MASARITTNSRSIWNFFKSQGLSEYGIAGLMGNLYAESGLSPINLENTGNTRLGKTDAGYTEIIDSGDYDNFIYDGFGYGLAQWTWWSRKKALYDFNKSLGLSIGDLNGQLKYLMVELKSSSYINLLNILKTATSVKEASDSVLVDFERPADMSDKVKDLRASYGQEYYDYFSSKTSAPASGGIAGNATASTNCEYPTYTIVYGDSLWSIANRYGITVNDIVAANNKIISNASATIYPGQTIIIPIAKTPIIQNDSNSSIVLDNETTTDTIPKKKVNLSKIYNSIKKTTHPILEKFAARFNRLFLK